jgi:murein DD-endopeptidase MepM/ murein hydrolase activator NlpD
MKDMNRPENGTGKVQETLRCLEVDSIARMTREEVTSNLQQLGMLPTKALPQQLGLLLTIEATQGHLVNVNPLFTSAKEHLRLPFLIQFLNGIYSNHKTALAMPLIFMFILPLIAATPIRGTPSIWPIYGEVTETFSFAREFNADSSYKSNSGIEIKSAEGVPVLATASGTVIYAGYMKDYGQLIIIDHGNGFTTRYGHLSRIEAKVGQSVLYEQTIGRVGSTGRSAGPHLHYEVRINDKPVDPVCYLPRRWY